MRRSVDIRTARRFSTQAAAPNSSAKSAEGLQTAGAPPEIPRVKRREGTSWFSSPAYPGEEGDRVYPITHWPQKIPTHTEQKRRFWRRGMKCICGVRNCPDMLRDIRIAAQFQGERIGRHRL